MAIGAKASEVCCTVFPTWVVQPLARVSGVFAHAGLLMLSLTTAAAATNDVSWVDNLDVLCFFWGDRSLPPMVCGEGCDCGAIKAAVLAASTTYDDI